MKISFYNCRCCLLLPGVSSEDCNNTRMQSCPCGICSVQGAGSVSLVQGGCALLALYSLGNWVKLADKFGPVLSFIPAKAPGQFPVPTSLTLCLPKS